MTSAEQCFIDSLFIFNGEHTVVEIEKDENLFVLFDQPDFCLIVFGGWRILRNHFRERRIANQGSLPGMTFKLGQ